MKMLQIPLVIVLLVVGGRGFNAGAQTWTNLHSFVGSPNDGANPYAALVLGSDGNFYSTTQFGGTNSCNCGSVFRISPNGSETNLYSFAGPPGDGAEPWAALILGSDGNFYGTATKGGAHAKGTVYRINLSGNETNLYSFAGSPSDGATPFGALVRGSDGNFYGTTVFGGTKNSGTVFRISLSGSYTNLYSFGSVSRDGAEPYGALAQGTDGSFYGTTLLGGTKNSGTVYRVSLSGSYTNLYSFGSVSRDGAEPFSALVQGADGNFYGTTEFGGTNSCSCGIVYRISPGGSYTNLQSLGGIQYGSYTGLMQGSDGNFYGVTISTAYRITPAGTLTTLFNLTTGTGGPDYPNGIVQASDGSFYGTTFNGGTSTNCSGEGCGIVFRFTVPLDPPPNPINQITSASIVATNIIFTVPSIAGETYQLQFTTDLTTGTWSNVPGVSVTNSIGALMTLTNFAGASQPQGFYRFDITP
jgi:uncharacterized repeat protein (TIGR03803 family)